MWAHYWCWQQLTPCHPCVVRRPPSCWPEASWHPITWWGQGFLLHTCIFLHQQDLQHQGDDSLSAHKHWVRPAWVRLATWGAQLAVFKRVTADEVGKLLGSMPAKSSPLDVLPTSLIKSCRSSFAHIIARLANLSFEHATFPAKFKIAQVTPLLKKQGIRPVTDRFPILTRSARW